MNRVDEARQKKWIQEEASRLGAGRPGGAGEVKQRRLPGGGGVGRCRWNKSVAACTTILRIRNGDDKASLRGHSACAENIL
jgi:hypothetical protein